MNPVLGSRAFSVSEVSVPRGLPNLRCAYDSRARIQSSPTRGVFISKSARVSEVSVPRGLPNLRCAYTSIAGRGYNPRQREWCSFLSQRGCRRFRCHAVYPTYSVLMIAGRGYNPRQREWCSFLSQRGCRRFRCHAVYPTYSVLIHR